MNKVVPVAMPAAIFIDAIEIWWTLDAIMDTTLALVSETGCTADFGGSASASE